MAEFVPVINQEKLYRVLNDLRSLPAKIEAKVMRGAFRKGMMLIAEDVRAAYPERTGKLRRSVRVTSRRRGGNISVAVAVGTRKRTKSADGKGRYETAFYAHLLEFGVRPHLIRPRKKGDAMRLAPGLYIAGAVSHPGFAEKGYLRRSFAAKADAAIQAMGREFERRLEAELRKLPSAASPWGN